MSELDINSTFDASKNGKTKAKDISTFNAANKTSDETAHQDEVDSSDGELESDSGLNGFWGREKARS